MLLAAAGAALISASAAQAQTASLVEVEDSVMLMPWNMTADAVEDARVLNPAGVELGEVEEVLGTDANTPTALVVDFNGSTTGFTGDRVIPIDRFMPDGNRLTLSTSAAEVASFPTYDD
ncbi:hypothetical protein D3218_02375 [Aureimonas flava]|uniref:PRC-barrel domain-containing protein n=2 Tax=Aureimonas flava TaxID=2320271 RepID=A0A3A1WX81_9HYPH|nr:hypothetical protein D3218_02375 [Aureimonas flava]